MSFTLDLDKLGFCKNAAPILQQEELVESPAAAEQAATNRKAKRNVPKPLASLQDDSESSVGTSAITGVQSPLQSPRSRPLHGRFDRGFRLLNRGGDAAGPESAMRNARGIKLLCMHISNSLPFKTITSCVLLAYIAFLGVQADAVAAYKREEHDILFEVQLADSAFTCFFILELIIRTLGYIPLHSDKLLPLDIITVVVQALENFLLTPSAAISSDSPTGHWTVLQSLCRMARLANIVKLLRRFRWLEPMYLLIRGIEKSLWSFLFVVMLLSIITIVTSLFFVTLLRHEELPPELRDHFRSLGWTALTLLEVILRGIEWHLEITRPLFDEESVRCQLAAWVFIAWVGLIRLCILGVVTAFFIETMDSALAANRERRAQERGVTSSRARELLEDIFGTGKAAEASREKAEKLQQGQGSGFSPPSSPTKTHSRSSPQSGPSPTRARGRAGGGSAGAVISPDKRFTWEEIRQALTSHPAELHKLGLTVEKARELFKQLSTSGLNDGNVQIGDFMRACMNLTRSNISVEALVVDLQQRKAVKDLGDLGSWCEEDIDEVVLSLFMLLERCVSLRDECEAVSWSVRDRVVSKSDAPSWKASRARMLTWLPPQSDNFLSMSRRISRAVLGIDQELDSDESEEESSESEGARGPESGSRLETAQSRRSSMRSRSSTASSAQGSAVLDLDSMRIPAPRLTRPHCPPVRKLWKGTLEEARRPLSKQISKALASSEFGCNKAAFCS